MTSRESNPFNVLIVGAGVAGLEAALALRELAGERLHTTMLAPDDHFVYRPMRVVEPFAMAGARRYPLAPIAADVGFELRHDAFKWLDLGRRIVHTEQGSDIGFDAVLIALGARKRRFFEHALTIDDAHLDEQLHGLIQDVESGYVDQLAFVVPGSGGWPLPIYELALLTARRAYDMGVNPSMSVFTSEAAPLALLGEAASQAVTQLLEDQGIELVTAARCETPAPGILTVAPGDRRLEGVRVVAPPKLFGPAVPGLPKSARDGFIAVDRHGRVPGTAGVFAAGDCIAFPIKHGGLAANQADAAAESIAALAGAPVEPKPTELVAYGILLGGDRPVYLRATQPGTAHATATVSDTGPAAKITAKYLGPYLETAAVAAVR